jgi:16S rRNA (guanine(1405)-N(7))-methyltransferase
MANSDDALEHLVEAVREGAKYRSIAPELVRAVGVRELAKGRELRETVKATRNKLHQMVGAYIEGDPRYDRWLADLAAAYGTGDRIEIRRVSAAVMRHHASTRERLPILDEFYAGVFSRLPPIRRVLDVACGLNPLALPWMTLAEGAEYVACDVDAAMVGFLGDYLALTSVVGRAVVRDIVADPPTEQTDLALVLKTIPCLEQFDKAAGSRLLDALNAPYLLVSFPARSLGGRQRGMVGHYGAHFAELVAGRGWGVEELAFGSEVAFLVTTAPRAVARPSSARGG